MAAHRVLVHISRNEHRVLNPDDVYFLRTTGGKTEIRLSSRIPIVDVRPIGGVPPLLGPFGFVRANREIVVNLNRISVIRLQADGSPLLDDGWTRSNPQRSGDGSYRCAPNDQTPGSIGRTPSRNLLSLLQSDWNHQLHAPRRNNRNRGPMNPLAQLNCTTERTMRSRWMRLRGYGFEIQSSRPLPTYPLRLGWSFRARDPGKNPNPTPT